MGIQRFTRLVIMSHSICFVLMKLETRLYLNSRVRFFKAIRHTLIVTAVIGNVMSIWLYSSEMRMNVRSIRANTFSKCMTESIKKYHVPCMYP